MNLCYELIYLFHLSFFHPMGIDLSLCRLYFDCNGKDLQNNLVYTKRNKSKLVIFLLF